MAQVDDGNSGSSANCYPCAHVLTVIEIISSFYHLILRSKTKGVNGSFQKEYANKFDGLRSSGVVMNHATIHSDLHPPENTQNLKCFQVRNWYIIYESCNRGALHIIRLAVDMSIR